jgi:hypothetical protein
MIPSPEMGTFEQRQIDRLHSQKAATIRTLLRETGLAVQEQNARIDLIPSALREMLPSDPLDSGFGLVGGFGIGKSFTLAALLYERVETFVSNLIEDQIKNRDFGRTCGRSSWVWCNWPEESSSNRSKLYENAQRREVEDWIERLQDPRNKLILDDIGVDRATNQDWTGELLGRVIDQRLRNGARTWWTSNLDQRALIERYGARLYSRLHALAPPIILPKLPDLRLRRPAS